MKQTPIEVLENKIQYYNKLKTTCETRDGIVNNENESEEETKKKFDGLIKECESKIQEFQFSIQILKRYNKIKNYIDNYTETKIEDGTK